jgi:SagB-type dehydrogenase family enzyme
MTKLLWHETKRLWQEIRLPSPDEDRVWELFHENSKASPHDVFLSDEEVVRRMGAFQECLAFDQYPTIELPPAPEALAVTLDEAIRRRVTCRAMRPCAMSLQRVATLLQYAYGVTRSNEDTGLPRASRAVPSGGALYPLELFIHSKSIEGLGPGLYHYNPQRNVLSWIREEDLTAQLMRCFVSFQTHLATDSALIILVTALFERSTFKYGSRGYRFVLLEAGHLAQNVNLVAAALGLGCIDIGGYFDRKVDEVLGIDGIRHSTVYMIGIGDTLPEEGDETGA